MTAEGLYVDLQFASFNANVFVRIRLVGIMVTYARTGGKGHLGTMLVDTFTSKTNFFITRGTRNFQQPATLETY